MNMSIRLENVNYIYGEGTGQEKWALKNINLTLHDNEFVGIVGHTGSGKSTLTQLLNGLEKPSSGQIFYNEQDIQGEGFSKKDCQFIVHIKPFDLIITKTGWHEIDENQSFLFEITGADGFSLMVSV